MADEVKIEIVMVDRDPFSTAKKIETFIRFYAQSGLTLCGMAAQKVVDRSFDEAIILAFVGAPAIRPNRVLASEEVACVPES